MINSLEGTDFIPFKTLLLHMYYIESILIYCTARVFQSALPPSAEGRVHCVCVAFYMILFAVAE